MTATSRHVPRLMWVTDSPRQTLSVEETAAAVVNAGVDAVHVREKSLSGPDLLQLVRSIQAQVANAARVIVNSSRDVAVATGSGLHLPEAAPFDDATFAGVVLCGRSVHSPESAAASGLFDYVIAGHVFPTGSKSGAPPMGLDGLARIVQSSPVPVLAIGGITPENTSDVLARGAHGVAVMSGIGSTAEPAAAARSYRAAIDAYVNSYGSGIDVEMIELTINGKPVQLRAPMTVQDFLDSRNLHRTMVVVEYNGTILKRDQYSSVALGSGDVLEVVHFVGGG